MPDAATVTKMPVSSDASTFPSISIDLLYSRIQSAVDRMIIDLKHARPVRLGINEANTTPRSSLDPTDDEKGRSYPAAANLPRRCSAGGIDLLDEIILEVAVRVRPISCNAAWRAMVSCPK